MAAVIRALASAINDAGTAVGSAHQYISGTHVGSRRCGLGRLGNDRHRVGQPGHGRGWRTNAFAVAVNSTGTIVGGVQKWVGGVNLGQRAVRWDASVPAAHHRVGHHRHQRYGLYGRLWQRRQPSGHRRGVGDKNSTTASTRGRGRCAGMPRERSPRSWGTWAPTITASPMLPPSPSMPQARPRGPRRDTCSIATWVLRCEGDTSGTAAVVLAGLGWDSRGATNSCVCAINDAGTVVGSGTKYVGGVAVSDHAVIWLPNGTSLDLNDLGVTPVSGGGSWTLSRAQPSAPMAGWPASDSSIRTARAPSPPAPTLVGEGRFGRGVDERCRRNVGARAELVHRYARHAGRQRHLQSQRCLQRHVGPR